MAFKRMDASPEGRARRAEEMAVLRFRQQDQDAFRGETSQEYNVLLVDYPVIEPLGGLTRIKARDEQGVFTLVLRSDRSPETVFEPRTGALNRALYDMPTNTYTIRSGVPAHVVGVEARVGRDGNRDPNGAFRAVFVERMEFTLNGETHTYGYARVQEADAVPKGRSNVVDFPSRGAQAEQVGADAKPVPIIHATPVAEDPRFIGRKLRSVELDLVGTVRRDDSKDAVFVGQNARGRVDVVLPGSRGEGWAGSPAGHALKAAWDASGKMTVTATGFFQSRVHADDAGKASQVWDFIAATVAFESGGVRHALGGTVEEKSVLRTDALVPVVKRDRSLQR